MIQPRPILRIKKQALTTPPFIGDSTLVDDTVALVDDATALSGGQVTLHTGLRSNVRPVRTYTNIKKRR